MFFILDVSHIVYPMWYGLPKMVRASDNHPVGVVHGCCSTFLNIATGEPSHIVAVYDGPNSSGPRIAIDPDYKSKRPELDPDLERQLPLARRAAVAFGFPIIEMPNCEADDVVAALTNKAVSAGHEVIILTSDKDLFPLLAHPEVKIFDAVRKRMLDDSYVRNKWSIEPHQVHDFLALVGDQTDCVPGVPKIGEKTASKLLNTYGDLETLLENFDEETCKPAVYASLRANSWRARLSKQLVEMQPIPDDLLPDLADLTFTGIPHSAVTEFLDEMELVTLREEIAEAEAA
jgi:DNA polymerase-1